MASFDKHSLERVSGLYVKDAPPKGRGVFCNNPIEAETVIEVCPTLLFTATDGALVDKTILYNYYFSAQFLSDTVAVSHDIFDKEKAGIIAFGMLSLCNHSDNPNACIEKNVENNEVWFVLKALKDISPHEEILISYGKVWFDAV